MRSRSRRNQRALENELFGSYYKPVLSFMPTRTVPPPIPIGIAGNCWACGEHCLPVYGETCPHCNMRYPAVQMYFYRTPILKHWKLCGMILRANGSIIDALKAVPTGTMPVSFDEACELDDGIITVCPD